MHDKLLRAVFPNTDREDWRDWRRYLTCRAAGHRIVGPDDRMDMWCERCGDYMLGDNKWQS